MAGHPTSPKTMVYLRNNFKMAGRIPHNLASNINPNPYALTVLSLLKEMAGRCAIRSLLEELQKWLAHADAIGLPQAVGAFNNHLYTNAFHVAWHTSEETQEAARSLSPGNFVWASAITLLVPNLLCDLKIEQANAGGSRGEGTAYWP